MLIDLRQKLPFQDQTVELIEAHDFFEHFSAEEIGPMLDDWYRVLIDGGKIILTLPEFGELLKKYVDDPLKGLHGIYGFYGEHKMGYTKGSMKELLEKHKFKVISVEDKEIKKDDCPRMEAICKK